MKNTKLIIFKFAKISSFFNSRLPQRGMSLKNSEILLFSFLQLLAFYFFSDTLEVLLYLVDMSCKILQSYLKPLFFSECTRNRPSYKEYLLQVSGIVPVGLCLHILPDASARPVAGSWSDLSCSVRERSVLF